MGQIFDSSKRMLPWNDPRTGMSIISSKWKLLQLNLKIMSEKDLNRLRLLGIFHSNKLIRLTVTSININFKTLSKIRSIKNIRQFSLLLKPAYSRINMKYDFQYLLKNMSNIRKFELMLLNVQFNLDEFLMSEKFTNSIKKLRKLDSLQFSISTNDLLPKVEKKLTKDHIKAIQPTIQPLKLSNLLIRKLNIKLNTTNNIDRGMDYLAFVLCQINTHSLRQLELDISSNFNLECSYENFEAFAKALGQKKKITSLDLNLFKSKKGGSHLLALGDGLYKLRDLRYLNFKLPRWDQISALLFSHLIKVIEKFYKIEKLSLELDLPKDVNELYNLPYAKNPESYHNVDSLTIKLLSQETPTTLITYILKTLTKRLEMIDLKYNQRYYTKHLPDVSMKIRSSTEMKFSYTIAHPFFWDNKEEFQIYDYYERASNLTKLHLELIECSGIHEECWTKTLGFLTHLKVFSLTIKGPSDFKLSNLAPIGLLVNLENLKLEFNTIDMDKTGCEYAIAVIKDMALVSLELSFIGNPKIGDNLFYSLYKYALYKCKGTIENLSVILDNSGSICYTGITYLTPVLEEMKKMKSLKLIAKDFKEKDMKLEDSSIELLAQSIAKLTRLNYLKLELRPFPKITDAGLVFLFQMLQASIYLKSLILNFYGSKASKISSIAAQILVKSLGRLHNFEISLVYLAELASFI